MSGVDDCNDWIKSGFGMMIKNLELPSWKDILSHFYPSKFPSDQLI
jgi:hypothetical protein